MVQPCMVCPRLDSIESIYSMHGINGSLWKLGLKFTDSADDIGFTLTQLCGILGGFALVVLVVAIAIVHRRTQRAF